MSGTKLGRSPACMASSVKDNVIPAVASLLTLLSSQTCIKHIKIPDHNLYMNPVHLFDTGVCKAVFVSLYQIIAVVPLLRLAKLYWSLVTQLNRNLENPR